jgi:hypothetical protein
MAKMAKLPTKLRVGYRDYAVEDWASNLANVSDQLGECDRINCIIRIRTDLIPTVKAEVLMHEVLHAAYHMGSADNADEEKLVSILGNQMTQIWRDNPDFVAFMSASLKA